jgi:hypothetical protein
MKATMLPSGRARRFAATALRAAVRISVTQLPSITARGREVSPSSTVTSEFINGSPRSGLRGLSASDFTTTKGGSSDAARVDIRNRPSGRKSADFGAFHIRPSARLRIRCSMLATASFVVISRASSSPRDR